MARKFFYVCGGILMLALAYHFGADAAYSQQAGGGAAISFYQDGGGNHVRQAVAANGDVFEASNSGGGWARTGNIGAGAVTVASLTAYVNQHSESIRQALATNGDVYEKPYNGGTWTLTGNIFGAPTPAHVISFGALKAKYR